MSNITKYVAYEDQTLLQVLSVIQESKTRCVIVLNNEEKVVGVVSQGDVVSALLKHIDLYTYVEKIMNRSFVFLTDRDMEKAVSIVLEKGVTILPIIDEENHLQDIIKIDDIITYLYHNRNLQEV